MEERRHLIIGSEVTQANDPTVSENTVNGLFLRGIDAFGPILCIPRSAREDDAASSGVKQFLIITILSVFLWLLSFAIIMLEVILFDKFTGKDWPMFVPMWIGSSLGIVGSISIIWRLYSSAKLITKERRLYMHAQGILEHDVYVDYESLPLMRMLFVWAFAGIVTFLSAFAAQLLYFWWFNKQISNIFEVYIPVGITCFFFMIYMFAMNIFSYKACFIFCLVMLQIILFSAKLDGKHKLFHYWLYATIPLYIVSVLLFLDYAHLWYQYLVEKTIVLHIHQLISLALFSTALILMNFASIFTSLLDIKNQEWTSQSQDMVYIVWIFAVSMVVKGAVLVWRHEAIKIAENRGCRDPLILHQTSRGWEPVENGNSVWTWSLGEIIPASHISLQSDMQNVSGVTPVVPVVPPNAKSYGTGIELSRV